MDPNYNQPYQTAPQQPVAQPAQPAAPAPVTIKEKRGPALPTVVFAVLAVLGFSFGIFEFIRNVDATNQINSLQSTLNSKDQSIANCTDTTSSAPYIFSTSWQLAFSIPDGLAIKSVSDTKDYFEVTVSTEGEADFTARVIKLTADEVTASDKYTTDIAIYQDSEENYYFYAPQTELQTESEASGLCLKMLNSAYTL